jgi:hypothetical protein
MSLTAVLFAEQAACQTDAPLPDKMQAYIRNIHFGKIGDARPVVEYRFVGEETSAAAPNVPGGGAGSGQKGPSVYHVSVSWNLADTVQQDDMQIIIHPFFPAVFHWAPHLTPTDEHIIAQHVFRAPALIAASGKKQVIIVPDLDILKHGSPAEWYMDMNAPENTLTLGLAKSQVREHVLYTRRGGTMYPPGELHYGFYILTSDAAADLFNPWRRLLAFFWQKWGRPLYKTGAPLMHTNMEPYVQQTYAWAFDSWKKAVWQEFTLNGKQVGAPVFIVNVTQSPDWPGPVNERELRSIWNQTWFSSLRSAEGLFRYARAHRDSLLMARALKTRELALSFPQRNGFFCSVIATEMEPVEIHGKF